MTDSTPIVVERVDEHRFVLVHDGTEAELVYEVRGDALILAHTEVPTQLGGRGFGGLLVRAAVERAARTGETLLPWCPFTRHWLKTHADEAATVAIDWQEPPE